MITIPNITANWFTDEVIPQLRAVDQAWKKVYDLAMQGTCFFWKHGEHLSYCITPSLYKDGALQITHFVDGEPTSHHTSESFKDFKSEVSDYGVNVYEIM